MVAAPKAPLLISILEGALLFNVSHSKNLSCTPLCRSFAAHATKMHVMFSIG